MTFIQRILKLNNDDIIWLDTYIPEWEKLTNKKFKVKLYKHIQGDNDIYTKGSIWK